MKLYKVKTTCFWGPQPGAETLHHKGEEILLHGTEAHIDEFFEPVEAEEEAPAPKPAAKSKPGPKPKSSPVEDLNDL